MQTLRTIIFYLALACIAVANISFTFPPTYTKPRNIIIMIGDGMGLAQISSAMAFYNGLNAFERFNVIGLSKTSSADNYVTDSGAGATAISIGKKTYNNAIGVDKDSLPHTGLFELAKKHGLSTGVAVTSSIVHATPASFYAHIKNRRWYEDIAVCLLKQQCDIAIGGGYQFFSNRKDKRDLTEDLQQNGYKVIIDSSEFKPLINPRFIYMAAADGMPKMQQGRGDFLQKASLCAIENLSKNKQGYMLMIEGSQIDWGGHEMNFDYMKAELIDFNSVINMVLNIAVKDKNTLVIVTADHETGGLAITEDDKQHKQFIPKFTYNEHTGIMVPVFAFGPGAEIFGGMYENTAIFDKINQLMGW
jgi:alkaline phosphatase